MNLRHQRDRLSSAQEEMILALAVAERRGHGLTFRSLERKGLAYWDADRRMKRLTPQGWIVAAYVELVRALRRGGP